MAYYDGKRAISTSNLNKIPRHRGDAAPVRAENLAHGSTVATVLFGRVDLQPRWLASAGTLWAGSLPP